MNIFYFIIIVGFGYIGFYYGKKVYDKVRKKRIYEVEDEYEYNKTSEDQRKYNLNLEMMIKSK